MRPRLLILHTGGTIGMRASGEGFRPMAGFAEVLERQLRPQASHLPAFDVVELGSLIDSANLQPTHWTEIASTLLAHWDDYDGFVVLHGTDTMAWTASALSFMLRGTDKPVILTGAQIPLSQPRSDAPQNLHAALTLAANPAIREVCVCFHHRLLRGNRSRKLKSTGLDAFDSPNWPALATIGIDIALNQAALLPAGPRNFVVPHFDTEAVAVLQVYPGMPVRIVEAMLDNPAVRGLVLRTYGVGNAPDADARFMGSLANAVARGIVIVNTTQCPNGRVEPAAYATGSAIARIGVVPGADMTLEAAFAKLHVLIASDMPFDQIRTRITQSLSGELS